MHEGNPVNSRSGAGKAPAPADLELVASAERRLIRPTHSYRHAVFAIKVGHVPPSASEERMPLTLALVLDRSGSMAGAKLATAKRAALAVLANLDERDRAAIVVFDDRIDLLQAREPVTIALQDRVRRRLERVEARATTALHQGWLTGCQTIAGDHTPQAEGTLARCFLLTDGLANVGLTDPEAIASQAAGVRENAGISTSTFGIGADYDEGLLGPMAVAGGGQFHHLRATDELARAFAGELAELLAVAAKQVRLEIALAPGVTADVVSAYWASPVQGGLLSVAIGDLLAGEERLVVIRFGFPPHSGQEEQTLRARLTWSDGRRDLEGPWRELYFTYADHAACDAEGRDANVMHWVGLHHAERAKRQATDWSRRGEAEKARADLRRVTKHIARYGGADPDLQAAIEELRALQEEVARGPLPAMCCKEVMYESLIASRMQRDHRSEFDESAPLR